MALLFTVKLFYGKKALSEHEGSDSLMPLSSTS